MRRVTSEGVSEKLDSDRGRSAGSGRLAVALASAGTLDGDKFAAAAAIA